MIWLYKVGLDIEIIKDAIPVLAGLISSYYSIFLCCCCAVLLFAHPPSAWMDDFVVILVEAYKVHLDTFE
jgi:hypothetical protein